MALIKIYKNLPLKLVKGKFNGIIHLNGMNYKTIKKTNSLKLV